MTEGIGQFLRFANVGVAATLIHTVIALVCIYAMTFTSTQANLTAFVFATAFSYYMNSTWSFRQELGVGSLRRFLAVSLMNIALIVFVSRITDAYLYPAALSVVAIVVVMPVANFFAHKLWTFK